MIDVFLNDKIKLNDIIGNLTISGSISNVSRVLKFKIIKGVQKINLGDSISIFDLELKKEVYFGFVWSSYTDSNTMDYEILCYDPLFYFTKSKIKNGLFINKNIPEIIKLISSETGITVGELPPINKKYKINARNKTLYSALVQSLESLSMDTGAKYYPIILDRKLSVIEIGAYASTIVDYKQEAVAGCLLHRKYKESLEQMINRVYVLDKQNNVVDEVFDNKNLKYGLIADYHKQSEAGNPKSKLKGRSVDIDISIVGDWTYRTGFSTGMVLDDVVYKFNILSDTHKYSGGVHIVDMKVERVV